LLAEDEHDLLVDVDRVAPEHRPRDGAQLLELREHEVERDLLRRLPRREERLRIPADDALPLGHGTRIAHDARPPMRRALRCLLALAPVLPGGARDQAGDTLPPSP